MAVVSRVLILCPKSFGGLAAVNLPLRKVQASHLSCNCVSHFESGVMREGERRYPRPPEDTSLDQNRRIIEHTDRINTTVAKATRPGTE